MPPVVRLPTSRRSEQDSTLTATFSRLDSKKSRLHVGRQGDSSTN